LDDAAASGSGMTQTATAKNRTRSNDGRSKTPMINRDLDRLRGSRSRSAHVSKK
jgi:hypothetical protein